MGTDYQLWGTCQPRLLETPITSCEKCSSMCLRCVSGASFPIVSPPNENDVKIDTKVNLDRILGLPRFLILLRKRSLNADDCPAPIGGNGPQARSSYNTRDESGLPPWFSMLRPSNGFIDLGCVCTTEKSAYWIAYSPHVINSLFTKPSWPSQNHSPSHIKCRHLSSGSNFPIPFY